MQVSSLEQTFLNVLVLKTDNVPGAILAKLNQLSEEDWIYLSGFAKKQKLASLFYSQISALPLKNIPQNVLDALKAAAKNAAFFNMVLVTELKKILRALNDANIPVIVLKGTYLIKEVYPCLSHREMTDIDLLLPQEKILEARQILGTLGYGDQFDDVSEFAFDVLAKQRGQLSSLRKAPNLPSVDIHWNLGLPHEVYAFNIQELWERACKVDFWGEEALALSPEDLVIHICHHGSYHDHFHHGFRIMVDLVMIIDHFRESLDWQQLQTTVTRWEWSNGISLCLLITQKLFDFPLNDSMNQWINNQNLPATIISLAQEELMSKGNILRVAMRVNEFATHQNFLVKISLIMQRIFLHPSEMTVLYPVVRPTYFSFKLYFFYLVRIRDLWLTHSQTLKRALQNDLFFQATSERRMKLNEWL